MKSVLMILDAGYPRDIRLEKEIPELIGEGNRVSLLCYRRKGESRFEELDGLNIIRSKRFVSKRLKGLIDIYNALFFINPVLNAELRRIGGTFDIVHVHDLPAANTGLKFAKRWGSVSILDLHENYPEAIKIWFKWRKGILIKLKNSLFFSFTRWHKREERMVRSYDRIVAVVDEMKDRLIAAHNLDENKITVVSNTEKVGDFRRDTRFIERANVITYVGGIGPHRGLQTAILAMPEILKKYPDARLQIVGGGSSDNINFLQELARENLVEASIDFTGPLPFERAKEYMANSSLNIIPHLKNDHTDNTIPHKLFQIMSFGYPLMVSNSSPLMRVVNELNAGIVFEAGSPKSFSSRAIWAFENNESLCKMAINASVQMESGKYSWEYDAARLLQLYASL